MTLPDRRLLEYLEDEVTGSERAAIEAGLADSPPARRRLGEMEEMLAGLRATDEVDAIDLVASVRAAVERTPQALTSRRSRARRWLPVAGGAAAVVTAAAVIFFLAWPRTGGEGAGGAGGFRAKSAGEIAADREVGLEAFVVEDGEPERLVGTLPQGSGLLFAYRNRSARRHLMIFAVDGRGQVFWFYPAHEAAGSDPRSIEIESETGASAVELPDLIHHDLAPGAIAIYALFTAKPLPVSAVEAAVASAAGAGWDPRRPARLPIAGSAQQVVSAEVTAR